MSSGPTILDTTAALRDFVLKQGENFPKVWAYVRVSTAKQNDDGMSLEGQRAAILDYCKAHQLEVPVFVQEVASAAKPTVRITLPGEESVSEVIPRPLLLLLLALLREHRCRGVTMLVWKLDRLTRVAAECEFFLRILTDHGVNLISTWGGEQDLSGSDPTRALMRTILNGFAAYEHAMILNRMAMGRAVKKARGGWCAGRAPYGYRNVERDLQINEEEAEWVRRALYYHTYQALSSPQISALLNRRYRSPDAWYPVRIQRIIHNRPLYEGTVVTDDDIKFDRPDLRIVPDDWNTWREKDLAAHPEVDQ